MAEVGFSKKGAKTRKSHFFINPYLRNDITDFKHPHIVGKIIDGAKHLIPRGPLQSQKNIQTDFWPIDV